MSPGPTGALGVPRWAALRAGVEALVNEEGRFTFAHLYAGATQGAQLLEDLGVGPGDRVGLAMRTARVPADQLGNLDARRCCRAVRVPIKPGRARLSC